MELLMSDIAITIATEALNIQIELDNIAATLEEKKEQLRELAGGKTKQIVVENLGKINITAPRVGSQKVELNINEDQIQKVPDLRDKLIEKGIAKQVLVINKDKLLAAPGLKEKLVSKGFVQEQVKTISAAKASVRIQPNV
jgi:hypothetical protein